MIVIDISEIINMFYTHYKKDSDITQDVDNWFIFNIPYPLQETEINQVYNKEQILILKEKHLLKYNEPFPIHFIQNITHIILRKLYKRSIDKKAINVLIKKFPELCGVFFDSEDFNEKLFYYKVDDLIDNKVNDILLYYEHIRNYFLKLNIVNSNLFIKRTINVYQMLFDHIDID